ncbi:phosphoglucomutase/phosphomannomutase family protein [[Phormidium] sp. ETS-05]|uniref:phosphoglucomutase/phosphomannomutase family protein n=1 Tax=[Phormidium] sp. ETS-05 TaxID=222819 RepID=UPI001E2AB897|nr:phosphoglucomutase/phosphomannomutase family protein [[Phormidium] sp. ETS-05]
MGQNHKLRDGENPIKFGTDGWRGRIAADYTFERVAVVAPAAARVLAEVYGNSSDNRKVLVGYDRRFMAEDFARTAAEAVAAAGFEVWLSDTYAPTPAFSWLANAQNALGAIVITASHNPAGYLGLKVKGAFGGSVGPEVTQRIEALVADNQSVGVVSQLPVQTFDPWPAYSEMLRQKVDLAAIRQGISEGKLTVFADVMHGAAAGGLARVLGVPVREINDDRNPLFDGGAPEPLPKYLSRLFREVVSQRRQQQGLCVGFAFDGDADRIAAVDGQGNFLSSQILIPILIQHLAQRLGNGGEVIKTVSGSDLIARVAALYDKTVFETPIGYKYIADRMLQTQVLLGGEESGGIGYGTHVPERDALLSALYVLEAIAHSGRDLSELYADLQAKTGYTFVYDRLDLPLASMEVRSRLLSQLESSPFSTIAGLVVVDVLAVDGYKFRFADGSWLLIRFSGTEPVLRLYCEAPTFTQVRHTLAWAKDWANSVV